MKRRKIMGLLSGLCALTAILGGAAIAPVRAEASVKEEEVLVEQFYSEELSQNWNLHTASFYDQGNALHFTKAAYYGSAVILNGFKLTEDTKLVLDVNVEDYANNSYINLYIGGKTETTSVTGHSTQLALRDKTIRAAENDGAKNYTQNAKVVNTGKSIFSLGNGDFTITFHIKVADAVRKEYDITVDYSVDGESQYSATFENYEMVGKYIGFDNSSNISWNLKSIQAYDGEDNLLFADNFAKDTVTEPTESASMGNWHITGNFTKKDIYVSKIASLRSDRTNAYAVNKNQLVNRNQVKTEQRLTFDVYFDEFAENTVAGVGLGLPTETAAADGGVFLGVRKTDGEMAEFVSVTGGEVTATDVRFPLSELVNNLGKCSLLCANNGEVSFSIGENSVTFKGINFEGYWALGQYALTENAASVLRFDNVNLFSNKKVDYASNDVSNNFSGIKVDDFGEEDYYVNTQKYYLGPKVSLAQKGRFVEYPFVSFQTSTAFSCFGYREKYDEFICEFDFINLSQIKYQAFGLSFAKTVIGTRIAEEYNPAVGFIYTNSATSLKTYGCKTTQGKSEVPIQEYNFFGDTTTKYNVMFIVRNRSVEVYYKEDGQPVSELGILRAKIEDVDTDGYVTVWGTNSASFQIYDFKITNLNETCLDSSALAIRERFTDEKVDDRLTLQGNTTIAENALTMRKDATLSMKEEDSYYQVRLGVEEIKDSLSLRYSGDKSLKISASGEITSVENGGETKLAFAREMDFSRPITLEVRVQGQNLQIGYREEGEVTETLYQPICTHTLTTAATKGKLTLAASDEIVLTKVDIFSLSDLYEAQPTDYIGNEDNLSPWVAKPLKQEEGSSCSSNAYTGATFGIFAAVLVGVFKKRKEDRE